MALRSAVARAAGANFSAAFRCPTVVGVRLISGRTMRLREERPKPFPQEKYDFNIFWSLFDRATTRFDENSKLVVVEGAHAVGKSAFAKELAEELDMVYFPYPRMDNLYINSYGDDFRKYAQYFNPVCKPYDEKDFARNPLGPVEGSSDRIHFFLFMEKFRNHVYALKHIFNTGQGVVMEGSPMSDYAYWDAAYNQGWIDRSTMNYYKDATNRSLHTLMKPNLIIYLDAPVEVVMDNIKARNNEWDKDSPVWTNKQYLNDIYNELKRVYLKNELDYSRVLVYDWTEPGDTEIVVEDIEALNFDYLPNTDTQQKDWRLKDEDEYEEKRYMYCNQSERSQVLTNPMDVKKPFDAPHLWMSPEDAMNVDDVMDNIKSERFAYGWNTQMGDKSVLFKNDNFMLHEKARRFYVVTTSSRPYNFFGKDFAGME